MKCNCRKCRVEDFIDKQEATGDGRHKSDWTGKSMSNVAVVGPDGLPVVIATITINSDPLIVEPQMAEKVLIRAVRQLIECVVNFSDGKVLN